MLIYAWPKSSYEVDPAVPSLNSLISVAFEVGLLQREHTSEAVACQRVAFVKCAYYSVLPCSYHLTETPHLHHDDE